MSKVLPATLAMLFLASCGHHHGYYQPPPPPLEYRHHHRLKCDHLVACHYYRGAHHFTPHRRHDRYWHMHRTARGYYQRCYVERRRHAY